MTSRGVVIALGMLCATAVFGEAQAQTSQLDTIEQRIEQLRRPAARPLAAEEAILTGKDDIVLLRKAKLFSLSAEATYRHTNNAFLSDNRKVSDDIFAPAVTFRAGTRIDQQYEVYAEVAAFGSRYRDNSQLDFDAFSGRIGGEVPVAGWLVGARYSATPVYERGVDNRIVTLHDLSLSARRIFLLGENTALLPTLTASRVFADPDDFTTYSGRVRALLVHRLTQGLAVYVGPQAYTRHYDDFFEDVTGETRRDYGVTGQAFLVWAPLDWVSLSGLVDVTQNWSTVDDNEYFAWVASPSVRLTLRF
jgi:hypothetical protein